MINWSDIAKGEIPEIDKGVLWYPSLEIGVLEKDGLVWFSSDIGSWSDIPYGGKQPEKSHFKLPLDVVRFWTEVNDPRVF